MSSSHSDRNRLTVLLWMSLSCIEWNVDSSSSFLEESSNQEALCVAAVSVWPSEVRSLGPKGNGSKRATWPPHRSEQISFDNREAPLLTPHNLVSETCMVLVDLIIDRMFHPQPAFYEQTDCQLLTNQCDRHFINSFRLQSI